MSNTTTKRWWSNNWSNGQIMVKGSNDGQMGWSNEGMRGGAAVQHHVETPAVKRWSNSSQMGVK